MGRFTTRVELHNATYSDYETLHTAMGQEGFTRTIQNDSTKTRYHLPTAEYNYINASEEDKENVLNKALQAANKTGKKSSILVTKSGGRTWHNLSEV